MCSTSERLCYRNSLCGREQQMGATLIVRQLVWAWNLWVRFLLYRIQCCLLLFIDLLLVLHGVPLCQFCSSTAELYPLANQRMSSFYIQHPISIHFPYIEVSSFWLASVCVSFLLRTPPTPDWLVRLSVPWLELPFRVRSLLYKMPFVLYHLSS